MEIFFNYTRSIDIVEFLRAEFLETPLGAYIVFTGTIYIFSQAFRSFGKGVIDGFLGK